MKIIVSRTDRAGDVILTTPVFRELRTNLPQARIIAHVSRYTAPLLRLCPWVDEIIVDDDFPTLPALAKKFISCGAQQLIAVHPSARVMQAAFLARIPRRTGRASNIWQFLLNDRRVQKRSRNEMHEYRYNLNLLEGIVENIDSAPPKLVVSAADLQAGKSILEKSGLTRPVLLHPGHGGSAYNLSPQQYAQLADAVIEAGYAVAVSIGPGEEQLARHFKAQAKLAFIENVPDLAVLAAILSECRGFVGGSTGPMHLAAALGLPVVAFFPPVRAMTPIRWGPVCEKNLVLMPETSACQGKCENCAIKPCMSRIDLNLATAWLRKEI